MTATVLFACVHNAGRSQIARAFFDQLADPKRARAISAGTRPANHVHPEVADAVGEVVSESDPGRDRETKRDEYARAHIPEYWIVDPGEATVTVLTLDGEHYPEHGVFGRGERARSALLAGFAVDVDSAVTGA